VILQAPSSFWTALVALAGSATPPAGVLQIVETNPQGGSQPQNLSGNAAVAALINPSSQLFTLPDQFGPSWIYIPPFWVEPLLGLNAPQGVELCLDAKGCCDFQGTWGAQFQAFGWTAGTPADGQWPILDT
jgi:hypothetical protein